jgi:transposase
MPSVALDVHRDFCEVAIKDESGLRPCWAGEELAQGARAVRWELGAGRSGGARATGPELAIARILEPHVGRVVIANTRKLRAIAESKVKTDKIDATTLCELLAAGFLPVVWCPDEWTRAHRRCCSAAQTPCAHARERRTSATRCWPATLRVARR